jgi:uncharacterized membrane protein
MLKFFGSIHGLKSLLKRHFLTGVLVLIPFGVVAWIFSQIFSFFLILQNLLPTEWQPEHYFAPATAQILNFFFVILISVVFVLAVSVLGWVSKLVIGAQFLTLVSRWIERIPVIRSIYSSLNQLLKTMASGSDQQFNRVVYIEYPRKGIWALAFVTSTAKSIDAGEIYLNVYIPTTPNPTSGFHLIVNEKEVRDSHLSVEDAFKTILSLGIAQS